jgi:hypothetical protein
MLPQYANYLKGGCSMKKLLIACFVLILLLLLLSTPGFADPIKKNIEVTYNNIQLIIDGTKITPKDVNGNIVGPFIYNGTTYLPVRAVGEALGKTVDWDGATQTVYVGDKPATITPLPAEEYITIKNQQYSTSLTELSLANMELTNTDIAPLSKMTNLTNLSLWGNKNISDVSVLSNLTNLRG